MVELDRKTFRDVDWLLVLSPIALTLLGCLGIYSTAPGSDFVRRQIIALVIGIGIMAVAALTDYRKTIVVFSPFFYALTLVLMILVLFIGVEVNGNRAWLRFAGFSFQPSEFAKVATILMLARYMSSRINAVTIRDLAVMTAIAVPPIVLIQLQNDTGTMLTFGAILAAYYFLGGMRKRLIVATALSLVVGLVAIYPHLKGYQKQRIMAVVEPEKVDPRGYGYQTIQSVIAVGSGGLLGKGVGEGTQGRLGFVPYAYSDFIAAVIAEEMGFAGVLLMLVLYMLLISRLISIARGARGRAGSLMVMGFVALVTFHVVCNLGMVVGLMPIMGIPLPLMSYGGTSVMSMMAGVGLALSVRLRRFVN